MKIRNLLTSIIAFTSILPSMGYEFSYTYQGQSIVYTVLDEEAKTVSTKGFNPVNGDLTLPAHPMDGEVKYTLVTIGDVQFGVNLLSVTIPSTVTTVGEQAFSGCEKLASVTIPNSVKSIGGGAFSDCKSLKSLILPSDITIIHNETFSGCSSLASLSLPEAVTSIGESAFYSCSSLTSITLPKAVTSIGESAFSSCSSLASIALPESLTSIGESAFFMCSSLTSVTVPSSVTSIGNNAFDNCSNLSAITFAEPTKLSIGEDAFNLCTALKSVNTNSVKAWVNIHFSNKNSNPTTYAKNLLVAGETIRRLTIPEGVKYLNAYAFYNCEPLVTVNIPSSLEWVDSYPFNGCTGLQRIIFPKETTLFDLKYNTRYSILKYGNSAQYYIGSELYSPEHITIPSSMTAIPNYAFMGWENLKEVTFHDNIKQIGTCAFEGCSRLGSLTLPNSVTSIGNNAFFKCASLKKVTLSNSLTTIPEYAFSECTALTSIIIPEGIKTIDEYAFYKCRGLISLTTPSSLSSIGRYAFHDCDYIYEIRIADINRWARISFANETSNPMHSCHWLYVGNGKNQVYNIVVEGSEPISDFAFYKAPIMRLRIKDGALFGSKTFYNCANITHVCLNSTTLPENAFSLCKNLKNLYVPLSTPPVASDNAFAIYDGVKLYVPAGSVQAYENAQNCWWRFLDVSASDFTDLDKIFAPDYTPGTGGIDDIPVDSDTSTDTGSTSIYTLQGICVKRNATEADIKALAPGLYIIRGKKVWIR